MPVHLLITSAISSESTSSFTSASPRAFRSSMFDLRLLQFLREFTQVPVLDARRGLEIAAPFRLFQFGLPRVRSVP